MNITFIVVALLMMLLSLAFVLPAFLRRPCNQHDTARDENISAARERLDDARAVASDTTPEEVHEYEEEIAYQLLQEAGKEISPALAVQPVFKKDWRSVVFTTVVLLLFTPLLYFFLGTPATLMPPPSIEELTAKLKQRTVTHPQDAEALAWLGRVMGAQGDYAAAADYYARARAVVGNTSELLAANIDALMMKGLSTDDDTLSGLLTVALIKTPEAPSILWLAGLHAERRGLLDEALGYWWRAHDNLADVPEAQNDIAVAITDLEEKLVASSATKAKKSNVVVIVQLSQTQRVDESDTLFIFAKAADDGASVPLAVRSLTTFQLPLTVTLSDDDAMAPAINMSSTDSYDIVARLSQSGNAIIQQGDRQGSVDGVSAGTMVTVLINTISSGGKK
ncbi:c-type cytochrome biogenesis protein CcmI [Candidatus Persebacteraceae bacterium Df01]|jgi:cytochrome c-type biogenesis protein CcmH|uniref:C-type cytochrome biogenesis protein CcmI n=1 Tax=Candidatus Doriopsillibacter californiensis TaxID=2970740 RepID=A0ABT7QL57_9GAMM|nr:c-type cytochrome biogenesis protein CcmI [Candidatus Persebacteraceae bacterium Df01]